MNNKKKRESSKSKEVLAKASISLRRQELKLAAKGYNEASIRQLARKQCAILAARMANIK